ncbi:MAG: alpha/beta fold hydrolase, partial [Gaiellaceae bacterium]
MKPAALLLHAFPLDARMWDGQRTVLERAGYPVVAPDLPGPEPELGFQNWARRVSGLVEGQFLPVGVSMGGYLAFELWRQAAERIPALV